MLSSYDEMQRLKIKCNMQVDRIEELEKALIESKNASNNRAQPPPSFYCVVLYHFVSFLIQGLQNGSVFLQKNKLKSVYLVKRDLQEYLVDKFTNFSKKEIFHILENMKLIPNNEKDQNAVYGGKRVIRMDKELFDLLTEVR